MAMTFGKPDHVPYTMTAVNVLGMAPNMTFEVPGELAAPNSIGKVAKDSFGVDWTCSADGSLPVNDHFLLDDITKWKEVVHIPDVIHYVDDLAHANGLFMSPEIYRDLIKPQHSRIVKAIRDHGVLMEQHTCGKCEAIIPDFIEMGVQAWFPAQPSNDIKAIHATHKIALDYGMDTQGTLRDKDVSEEIIRSETRKSVDELSDGAEFAIMAGAFLGMTVEEMFTGGDFRMKTIADELEKYGKYTY